MDKIGLFLILTIAALGSSSTPASASSHTPLNPGHRFQAYMDDGSRIDVDNASHMPDDLVQDLVLVADRSTQTGCPFDEPKKGFFKTGDRIFISDYYIAWFDYTLDDGVDTPLNWPDSTTPHSQSWSRSGTLAGLWSLDPSTQNFRYFYNPVVPVNDEQNHICWNWPRNELIPGSNSPGGQLYWWDKYGPPLEHTIVVPTSADGSKYDLFGAVYAEFNPKVSNFTVLLDGLQDADGVHYKTQAYMTSWIPNHSTYTNIKTGEKGRISYILEFICKDTEIEVKWEFAPETDIEVENLYVDLWLEYAGQNDRACNTGGYYPLPTRVYGLDVDPYHSYNYVQTHSSISDYTFPWTNAKACSGVNYDVGIGGNFPFVKSSLIRKNQFIRTGFESNMNPAKPGWQMTNLVVPNAGNGTQKKPIGFPFNKMITNYENSDQQQGLILARQANNPNNWFTLRKYKWYQAHYSLSTSFREKGFEH